MDSLESYLTYFDPDTEVEGELTTREVWQDIHAYSRKLGLSASDLIIMEREQGLPDTFEHAAMRSLLRCVGY